MRLIDRDALWERLTGKSKYYDEPPKDWSVIWDIIEGMPLVHLEPHWIPCSKKPDKRDVYRVTVQCEHVDGYPDYETCYGEYDEHDGWFLVGEPVGRTKMVAWMPIDEVEPYQPEEERL